MLLCSKGVFIMPSGVIIFLIVAGVFFLIIKLVAESEPSALEKPISKTDNVFYDNSVYNERGFDKNGNHKNGTRYDDYGYDVDGYDVNEYDRQGFDRNGYNSNGFDLRGYDKNGYDKQGFNSNGYDKYGYDKDRYNRESYNENGLPRCCSLLSYANCFAFRKGGCTILESTDFKYGICPFYKSNKKNKHETDTLHYKTFYVFGDYANIFGLPQCSNFGRHVRSEFWDKFDNCVEEDVFEYFFNDNSDNI